MPHQQLLHSHGQVPAYPYPTPPPTLLGSSTSSMAYGDLSIGSTASSSSSAYRPSFPMPISRPSPSYAPDPRLYGYGHAPMASLSAIPRPFVPPHPYAYAHAQLAPRMAYQQPALAPIAVPSPARASTAVGTLGVGRTVISPAPRSGRELSLPPQPVVVKLPRERADGAADDERPLSLWSRTALPVVVNRTRRLKAVETTTAAPCPDERKPDGPVHAFEVYLPGNLGWLERLGDFWTEALARGESTVDLVRR